MPRFSVIIPTFNRRQFLEQALESVFAQTFRDYEVIVVDDGSTDGTAELRGKWGGRATWLTQANAGAAAARNAGAGVAKGDYLAFLDSDDLLLPWALEVYGQALDGPDEVSFLAGKPLVFEGALPLVTSQASPEIRRFPDFASTSSSWPWWGVSSFVVARAAFRSCAGFAATRSNAEDADLTLRLCVSPGFVQVVSPFTFAYRSHPASLSADQTQTMLGVSSLVQAEKRGAYPGGGRRSRERRRIICRHVRPVALTSARNGLWRSALALYLETFFWHVGQGRLRFLLGFWLALLRGVAFK